MIVPSFILEPVEWRQVYNIAAETVHDRRVLEVWAKIANADDILLQNATASLQNIELYLLVLKGEPKTESGQTIKDSVGAVGYTAFPEHYHGFVGAKVFLDDDTYEELWAKIASDTSASCKIELTIDDKKAGVANLLERMSTGKFEWDVKAVNILYVNRVTIAFSRSSRQK